MVNTLKSLIAILVLVVAIAIALPTLTVKIAERTYQIRGIEPSDISEELVIDNFSYENALDLQGGSTVTYSVRIDEELSDEDKIAEFEEAKLIIATRMAKIGLRDFDFTTLVNIEENSFKLVLTTPYELEENLVQVLASPGVLDVLMNSPETEEETPEDVENALFPGSVTAGITNSDIAGAKVVSDSRIYTDDPENPNNFGIEIFFTRDGAEKAREAVLVNSTSFTPLIFTLDNSFVAVQASGQQVNPLGEVNSMLLYTYFADTRLNNAVLASVMTSPSLQTEVEIESTLNISPSLGENALRNIKYATFASVLLVYIVLLVLMRQRGLYVVIASEVFAVLLIASQKLTSMNLSLALIAGFFVIFGIFMVSQAIYINKIARLDGMKETKEFIDKYALSAWGLAVRLMLLVPFILIFENLLTVSVSQFVQSILSGLMIWFFFRFLFLKPITSIFVKNS